MLCIEEAFLITPSSCTNTGFPDLLANGITEALIAVWNSGRAFFPGDQLKN